MINRSLIRIKTVQILYSYLLTRKDFNMASAPDPNETSRDRQFAYSVYLDFIGLLLRMSGISLSVAWGMPPVVDAVISKNKLGRALSTEATIRQALVGRAERVCAFDECMAEIVASLRGSKIYDEFRHKRKHTMNDDVSFWISAFTEVLRKNKTVESVLRRDEMFSHVGLDMGVNMLAATLAGFDDTRSSFERTAAELKESLLQAYNLYHALLWIPVALTDIYIENIRRAQEKYLPTEDALKPNMKLADNLYVAELRENSALKDYIVDHANADPGRWRDFDTVGARLLDVVMQSELYTQYLECAENSYSDDAAFWREALRTLILPSDELSDMIETVSIYWNDDLPSVSDFVLKTIRRSYTPAEDGEMPKCHVELMPMFMNAQDEAFGSELFDYVVKNQKAYRSYIDEFIDTKAWDTERIAFMDVVILLTAIAEIINYPAIPVPASINEYVQMANDYSTPKSGQFVNGILASIVNKLNADGIINK